MNHHLVILKKVYLDLMLQGRKTIECRLSQYKRPPFHAVEPGDTLWLKQSGGAVLATARAGDVEFIHPLSPALLQGIKRNLAKAIRADNEFFQRHHNACYATLLGVSYVRPIVPFLFPKRNQNAWVLLDGPLRQPRRRRGASTYQAIV